MKGARVMDRTQHKYTYFYEFDRIHRGVYNDILVDPPWKYNDSRGGNTKAWGGTDAHYPTMTQDQMKELPVGDLAGKFACLWMWSTMPFLPDAIELMEAWGFKYTTVAFVWVKVNSKRWESCEEWPGMMKELAKCGQDDWKSLVGMFFERMVVKGLGSWTKSNVEVVLLGKKGRPKRKDRKQRQIIFHPRGEHSAKPPQAIRRIEKIRSHTQWKIELFSRGRPWGWDAWGNENHGCPDRSHFDEHSLTLYFPTPTWSIWPKGEAPETSGRIKVMETLFTDEKELEFNWKDEEDGKEEGEQPEPTDFEQNGNYTGGEEIQPSGEEGGDSDEPG